MTNFFMSINLIALCVSAYFLAAENYFVSAILAVWVVATTIANIMDITNYINKLESRIVKLEDKQ